jgi:hypothetical protein
MLPVAVRPLVPDDAVVRLDVARGGLCRLLVRGCFFCICTTKEAFDRHEPSLLLVVRSKSLERADQVLGSSRVASKQH